jgi:hypothetical protein
MAWRKFEALGPVSKRIIGHLLAPRQGREQIKLTHGTRPRQMPVWGTN